MCESTLGVTWRDHVAAMMAAGLMQNAVMRARCFNTDLLAARAYMMADSLEKARRGEIDPDILRDAGL